MFPYFFKAFFNHRMDAAPPAPHVVERFAFAAPARLQGAAYARAPSGWANAVTDSVSGRVWAGMITCPAHIAFLHVCPLRKCVVIGCRVPRDSEGNRTLPPIIVTYVIDSSGNLKSPKSQCTFLTNKGSVSYSCIV